MYAVICDACRKPIGRDGFDVTVLRGVVLQNAGEPARFSANGGGLIAATLCERCGERISAILRRKLADPCRTCELEPMRAADQKIEHSHSV
jgi:hypothetical protein